MNQYLHQNLQQLDTAAQETRQGFVSHPHVLHTTTRLQAFYGVCEKKTTHPSKAPSVLLCIDGVLLAFLFFFLANSTWLSQDQVLSNP